MSMSFLLLSISRGLIVSATLFALSTGTFAQSRSAIDAAYKDDRAACVDSASLHDRSACLREAGAVRAEALRGNRMTGPTAEERARNTVQRCQSLPPDNKAICERMARGEGSATGSVAAGGILRELVTEVPATPLKAP
jgi:hypothetical protein